MAVAWVSALVVVVVVAVVAVAVVLAGHDDEPDLPVARVVDTGGAPAGWKTIEYEGVRVDIPASWARVDRSDCEFGFERWAEPDETGCETVGDGVSFYASATFDPRHGPGLRHHDPPVDGAAWAGYVYAGDHAVYAAGDDRAVVSAILRSARATPTSP